MNKLSTGDPATLGSYRKLAAAVFGEKSKEAVQAVEVAAKVEDGEVKADRVILSQW